TGLMRAILPQELKATTLMGMVIEEASAKIRAGGPLDLETDYAAPCWAGVIPVGLRTGAPIADPLAPPHGSVESELGHFAQGSDLSKILLATARRVDGGK